jgi:hypothetical protein
MQKEAADDAKALDGSDAVGRRHAKAAKAAQGVVEPAAGQQTQGWGPPATDQKDPAAADGYGAPASELGRVGKQVLGAMWNQTAIPILPGVNHFAALPLGQWSEMSLHQKAEDLPDGRQHRTRSFDLYLEEPVDIPIPVPFASASVGPIVETTLKCSIKAPKQPGDEAKKGFEKSDLPIDPEKVRTLAPGTEVSLQGFGELGVSGTAALGRSIAVGPLVISASAGPTEQWGKGAFFKFELRVGDSPGKVHVRIEHAPLTEHTRSLAMAIGAEGNWDGVNEKMTQMAQRAAGVVENTVDTQAFDKGGFRAVHTTTDVHTQPVVQTIDLDLNDPRDRQTYQTLIRFEPDVPVNDQRGQRDLHAGGVSIQLGPLALRRSKSIYETDHETVRTLKGESVQLDQAQMLRKTGGLFQHKTQVTVRAQETRGSGGDDGFLEVRLSHSGLKGKDLERMQTFAADLGVKWEKPKDGSGDKEKKDSGESLDLFVTEKGVEKIAGLPEDDVLRAYAEQSDKYRGAKKPLAWSTTANGSKALSLIRRWRSADSTTQRDIQDEYRDAFKKAGFDTDISRASDELDKAEKVARFTATLSGKWGRKEFGQFTQALGRDLWPALGTLTALAGRRNIRVQTLQGSGDAGNITAKSQATPVDGFTRINRVMDPTLKSSDVDAVEQEDDDDDNDGDDDS